MKFSHCGRLLATAGQDNVVRIWVLKTAFDYFNNMRLKYNTEGNVTSSASDWTVGPSCPMLSSLFGSCRSSFTVPVSGKSLFV